ncbi:MAG TPA: surface-adhesin E family protein [Pyrinomonadaceae bacterium]|nr:surface-adhesin E family protein [Pyrinomonadaceae bacterium]
MSLNSNLFVKLVTKIMRDYSTVRVPVASVTILALTLLCFGQNSNSSSTKSANKRKKRSSTKQPKLDLTGIDLSVFDWAQVGTTDDSVVSYGIKTVRRLNGNVVRAWIRTELKDDTEQSKSEFLRNRRAQALRTFGYENYSHTLELNEYNCAKGEGRVLSRIDYDAKGNVIDSTMTKNSEWTYVVPASIGESLSRALCKRK